MSDKIRVALADDHPILLAGLRNLIEAEADLELVGDAARGDLARDMIRDRLPDVAVIDISMPEIGGIALAKLLTNECPSVRILVLTVYEERSFVMQSLAAGVHGYLLKRSAAENLVQAIRAVKRGELYIDSLLASDLRNAADTKAEKASQAGSAAALTDREESVLKYCAQGLTIKEIAGRLNVSAKTVETYKARASEKLKLNTRAEIIRFASANGWLAEA